MTRLIVFLFVVFCASASLAQSHYQYFDGADTLTNSLIVTPDTNNHVWQIGRPQKTLFYSAATIPNAIVTDTVNFYPSNDTSSFIVSNHNIYSYGTYTLAYRWKQKLDLEKHRDGGIIEFSIDSGATWENAFNNPNVYNFYGFNPANKDTLDTARYAFSGTDTSWSDIWLCFRSTYANRTDSFLLRFTIISDSADSSNEGWLIDNFTMHQTFMHTVVKVGEENKELKVFPSITTGLINIELKDDSKRSRRIEDIHVVDATGRVAYKQFCQGRSVSTDVGHLPNGEYILKVRTDVETATFRITVRK